ncbi:hypothetical protein P692DRAFT_20133755 [Suillus brevipes Sb2]|nr:hypothetical protein P692DRAFT_20133755 [Suillus brevipes Sb2]
MISDHCPTLFRFLWMRFLSLPMSRMGTYRIGAARQSSCVFRSTLFFAGLYLEFFSPALGSVIRYPFYGVVGSTRAPS